MPENKSKILFEKFHIDRCLKKDDYTGVYLANHIYLEKNILLKTLDTHAIPDKLVVKRFQREAQLLAKLKHPNIIQVLDFGTYQNYFYISFEFFPSENLRIFKNHHNTLSEQNIRTILVQLLKALAHAHQQGIIHRDLKPENILINSNLDVKIADFGLAINKNEPAKTEKNSIVGTPGYMSPEQICGETLTPQSDLFSLGIIACEMFIDKNPFIGADINTTINNILSLSISPQELSAVPEPFCRIIPKLLQHNKNKRYQTAFEVLSELGIRPSESPKKPNYKIFVYSAAGILILFIFFLTYSRQTIPQKTVLPVIKEFGNSADSIKIDSTKQPKKTLKTLAVKDTLKTFIAKTPYQPVNELKDKSPGKLFVRCLPWADIYLDSKHIDTTPLEDSIRVEQGTHTLELIHPEFPPFYKEIEIKPQQTTLVQVALDTLFGYIDCKVYPWGEVYIDDKFYGQTPFSNALCLVPGTYKMTIKNPNYSHFQEYIKIQKKDTLKYRFNFEKTDQHTTMKAQN